MKTKILLTICLLAGCSLIYANKLTLSLSAPVIYTNGNYLDYCTDIADGLTGSPVSIAAYYDSDDGTLNSVIFTNSNTASSSSNTMLYSLEPNGSYTSLNIGDSLASAYPNVTYDETISSSSNNQEILVLGSYETAMPAGSKESHFGKKQRTGIAPAYSLYLYNNGQWSNIPLWSGYNYQTLQQSLTAKSNLSVYWSPNGGNPEIFCTGDVFSGNSYVTESLYYNGTEWNELSFSEGFSAPVYCAAYGWGYSENFPQAVAADNAGEIDYLNQNMWQTIPAISPSGYDINNIAVDTEESAAFQGIYPQILVTDNTSSIYYFSGGTSGAWTNLTSSSIPGSNILPFSKSNLMTISELWASVSQSNVNVLASFSDGSVYYYDGDQWTNLIPSSTNYIGNILSALWDLNPGETPSFISADENNSSAAYYDSSTSNSYEIPDVGNISSQNSGAVSVINFGLWNPLGVPPSYTVLTGNECSFHHIYKWLSLSGSITGISNVSWESNTLSQNDHLIYGTPSFYSSSSTSIESYTIDSNGNGSLTTVVAAPSKETISMAYFSPEINGLEGYCVALMKDGSIWYYTPISGNWTEYPSTDAPTNITAIYPDWQEDSPSLTDTSDILPPLVVETANNNFYQFLYGAGVSKNSQSEESTGTWSQIITIFLSGATPVSVNNLWYNGNLSIILATSANLYSYTLGEGGFVSDSASSASISDITDCSSFLVNNNPVTIISYTSDNNVALAEYTGGNGGDAFNLIADDLQSPTGFLTNTINTYITPSGTVEALLGSTNGSILFYNGNSWQTLPSISNNSSEIDTIYANWSEASAGSVPQIAVVYGEDSLAYYNPQLNSWDTVTLPGSTENIADAIPDWPSTANSLPYFVVLYSNNSLNFFI